MARLESTLRSSLVIALATVSLSAHDLWIPPGRVDEIRALSERPLQLGGGFQAESSIPFSRLVSTRLELSTPRGVVDLLDPDSGARISECLESGGTVVLAMEVPAATLALDGAKFNAYLEEEGHIDVLARRRREDIDGKPARERYTRHIKAVFTGASDPGHHNSWSHRFGLPLEIVPDTHPDTLRRGSSFGVIVLIDGEPAPGQRVVLYSRDEAGRVAEQAVRTSENGSARFEIRNGGEHLARTTALAESNDGLVDYESRWAAFSFFVPVVRSDESDRKRAP